MRKLRYAVFGTGFWSHYQIPAWEETGETQLVALFNRTKKRALEVAAKFGVAKVYDTPDELLDNEDLDFVDIITEAQGHESLVKLCADRGIPVICQKPMAENYQTALEMVKACESNGVPFFVHENYRWQEPIRACKALVDSGRIGTVFRLNLNFVHALPEFAWANQPLLKTLPRLVMSDQGSHQFDLARFFLGEMESVYASSLAVRPEITGEQAATVILKNSTSVCTVTLSFVTFSRKGHFPQMTMTLEGTKGTIELDIDFLIRVTDSEGTHSWRCPPTNYHWADHTYLVNHASMVPIHRNFIEYFRTGKLPETTSQDNLKTMRLVEAAYRSAERNVVVAVETL